MQNNNITTNGGECVAYGCHYNNGARVSSNRIYLYNNNVSCTYPRQGNFQVVFEPCLIIRVVNLFL